MALEWTDELSVGNAMLDFEHKGLILAVSDIAHAIKERKLGALKQWFEYLDWRLQSHFLSEELLAKAVNYDFSGHKAAQQYSLNEIQNLKNELFGKKIWSDYAAEHFIQFLERWVIDEHILRLDMKMKPVLLTLPYEYNLVKHRTG